MPETAARLPRVVLIGGGSATGKSTLARSIAAAISDLNPIVICQDRYFRDFAELTPEEREMARTANHPNSMNWGAFHAALDALSAGKTTQLPAPGTRSAQRGDSVETVGPAGVLIVEGLFALWDERCRAAGHLKLYTEIDDDERVLRRLHRDITERGGTVENVLSWYRRDVKPNYPIYTASTRYQADLIVPTHHPVDAAVAAIAAAIRALC